MKAWDHTNKWWNKDLSLVSPNSKFHVCAVTYPTLPRVVIATVPNMDARCLHVLCHILTKTLEGSDQELLKLS